MRMRMRMMGERVLHSRRMDTRRWRVFARPSRGLRVPCARTAPGIVKRAVSTAEGVALGTRRAVE